MSEIEAKERYYWSKIRQALKDGRPGDAEGVLWDIEHNVCCEPGMEKRLAERIAKTFAAGCIALGDPAPLDKEQDHD